MRYNCVYMTKPIFLYRFDDGARFTLNCDGNYTMDESVMSPKYEYSYKCLINKGFVDSLDKCVIKEYETINDGHGDID